MKVADIMSGNVLTILPDTTVGAIAKLLAEHGISGVPVVSSEGKLLGMVTERDLLYKDAQPHFPAAFEMLGAFVYMHTRQYNEELKKVLATRADEIMTTELATIHPDATVEQAATLMLDRDISRIPVMKGTEMVGIISRSDVIRYLAGTLNT